jgi:hypothetical protein
MAKGTSFKSVVVKEDPKTSLAEAGIYSLSLADGGRVVAIGHTYFPNHDRSLHEVVLRYLRDTRPQLVILLGGIIDEEPFRSLAEEEDNYLHDIPDAPELAEARKQEGFEAKVLTLGKFCGSYIKTFAEASGGKVVYIPSATHLSMPNEVRLMDFIQRRKKVLDAWTENHPDATELPSNPDIELPRKLSKLFGIDGLPNVDVLRYGSSVKVNGKTLFMIGDFRRRHPGDASKVEWEQRGKAMDIVRSFDGKLASSWMTTPKHTLPGLVLNFHEFHEVGYLWDPTRMGHLRDYDRRAPGFWSGVIVHGELFGHAVVIVRGDDGRRSFVVDGAAYTEAKPSALPNGRELTLTANVDETETAQLSASRATPRPKATRAKRNARGRKRSR